MGYWGCSADELHLKVLKCDSLAAWCSSLGPTVQPDENLKCVFIRQLFSKLSCQAKKNPETVENIKCMLTADIKINARSGYNHCEMDTTYKTIHLLKQQSNQTTFNMFQFKIQHFTYPIVKFIHMKKLHRHLSTLHILEYVALFFCEKRLRSSDSSQVLVYTFTAREKY